MNQEDHLRGHSRCGNAGANETATTALDFSGSPRVQGGAVDIGAGGLFGPPLGNCIKVYALEILNRSIRQLVTGHLI